jgi:hypothetical protein
MRPNTRGSASDDREPAARSSTRRGRDGDREAREVWRCYEAWQGVQAPGDARETVPHPRRTARRGRGSGGRGVPGLLRDRRPASSACLPALALRRLPGQARLVALPALPEGVAWLRAPRAATTSRRAESDGKRAGRDQSGDRADDRGDGAAQRGHRAEQSRDSTTARGDDAAEGEDHSRATSTRIAAGSTASPSTSTQELALRDVTLQSSPAGGELTQQQLRKHVSEDSARSYEAMRSQDRCRDLVPPLRDAPRRTLPPPQRQGAARRGQGEAAPGQGQQEAGGEARREEAQGGIGVPGLLRHRGPATAARLFARSLRHVPTSARLAHVPALPDQTPRLGGPRGEEAAGTPRAAGQSRRRARAPPHRSPSSPSSSARDARGGARASHSALQRSRDRAAALRAGGPANSQRPRAGRADALHARGDLDSPPGLRAEALLVV